MSLPTPTTVRRPRREVRSTGARWDSGGPVSLAAVADDTVPGAPDLPSVSEVAARLEAHEPGRGAEEAHGARAAATALVVRDAARIEVLLIRRTRRRDDRWSGQMALPGGRREPGDEDLVATARRETCEEVGLELPEEPIGHLDHVSARFSEVVVAPFVFEVAADVRPEPAEREVAEVVWVPLAHLASPEARTVHFQWGWLPFPAIGYGEHRIWGLTRRVLLRFLEVVGL